MREQDTRSSTGRGKEEIEIWDMGENGKTKDKRKEKRASREICLLRWIFPSSRFFCQFLKSTSRSALWLFEESLHSSITRPSLRCFVPGYAWMSSGGDPWAESSQDSIHPHLSVGSSRYRPLQRHGRRNRRKHQEAAVHLQLSINVQQASRSFPYLLNLISFLTRKTLSSWWLTPSLMRSFVKDDTQKREQSQPWRLIQRNPVTIRRRVYAYFLPYGNIVQMLPYLLKRSVMWKLWKSPQALIYRLSVGLLDSSLFSSKDSWVNIPTAAILARIVR